MAQCPLLIRPAAIRPLPLFLNSLRQLFAPSHLIKSWVIKSEFTLESTAVRIGIPNTLAVVGSVCFSWRYEIAAICSSAVASRVVFSFGWVTCSNDCSKQPSGGAVSASHAWHTSTGALATTHPCHNWESSCNRQYNRLILCEVFSVLNV